MTKLDPRLSEFESTEVAESYDCWFRAKVETAIADTRPKLPHDQVMAEMEAIIVAAERRPA
ncbi:type II toxin-antitoxin system RelB family antitoxin [Novilysobacter spongiicola]|uniref:Stability determinant domain-containing protein n=1 Tax=Lysobacter spongiicola DSM 21749 TaxID=1122188 RepID=A0A1T4M0M7_9GAMM|nr:antitoxin [Lysobacter spongiicola]SJZ60560.1 hypothetical protein SAMN02745674_00232 [Lysobacter spongiicola DSM 21749]